MACPGCSSSQRQLRTACYDGDASFVEISLRRSLVLHRRGSHRGGGNSRTGVVFRVDATAEWVALRRAEDVCHERHGKEGCLVKTRPVVLELVRGWGDGSQHTSI